MAESFIECKKFQFYSPIDKTKLFCVITYPLVRSYALADDLALHLNADFEQKDIRMLRTIHCDGKCWDNIKAKKQTKSFSDCQNNRIKPKWWNFKILMIQNEYFSCDYYYFSFVLILKHCFGIDLVIVQRFMPFKKEKKYKIIWMQRTNSLT